MRNWRKQIAGIDELLIWELIGFFQRFNDFNQRLSDLNCALRQRIGTAIERQDMHPFRILYTCDANSFSVSELNEPKAENRGRLTVVHTQTGFHKPSFVSNPIIAKTTRVIETL